MDHEYNGDRLRGGTEEQDPHGRDISKQVDSSDHHIYDGDGDPGVSISKEEKGGVVQLYVVGVSGHDPREKQPVGTCVVEEAEGKGGKKNADINM